MPDRTDVDEAQLRAVLRQAAVLRVTAIDASEAIEEMRGCGGDELEIQGGQDDGLHAEDIGLRVRVVRNVRKVRDLRSVCLGNTRSKSTEIWPSSPDPRPEEPDMGRNCTTLEDLVRLWSETRKAWWCWSCWWLATVEGRCKRIFLFENLGCAGQSQTSMRLECALPRQALHMRAKH